MFAIIKKVTNDMVVMKTKTEIMNSTSASPFIIHPFLGFIIILNDAGLCQKYENYEAAEQHDKAVLYSDSHRFRAYLTGYQAGKEPLYEYHGKEQRFVIRCLFCGVAQIESDSYCPERVAPETRSVRIIHTERTRIGVEALYSEPACLGLRLQQRYKEFYQRNRYSQENEEYGVHHHYLLVKKHRFFLLRLLYRLYVICKRFHRVFYVAP